MCGERERGEGREGGRVHVVICSCITMYKYNHVMYNIHVQDLGKERAGEGKNVLSLSLSLFHYLLSVSSVIVYTSNPPSFPLVSFTNPSHKSSDTPPTVT